MSGGHFEYRQYNIGEIAEDIHGLIVGCDYSESDRRVFLKAYNILKAAEIYAQRVDWYVSGDDGEESFKRRLVDDLKSAKLEAFL